MLPCVTFGHPIDCPGHHADASPAVILPAGDVSPTEPRQRGASGATLAPVESAPAELSSPLARLTLLELIPALSPQFEPPEHLTEWCALIERSLTEPIRALCSIPVRHFKTETTVHGIAWLLMRDPTLRIVFLTHSFEAAAKWSKRIRQLCEATDKRAGVPKGTYGPTRGWDTIAEWRNESGGGVVVMSADQSKIGYDCHLLIVDDAIDEHGAEEPEVREAVDAAIVFYSARCMRRGKAGAVLIVASRFHPDDPTGRRLARIAVVWIYVHHAAIEYWCRECGTKQPTERALCDVCGSYTEERAFAPKVWGLEALKRVREEAKERDPSERMWWSQFQNDPHPESSDSFGAATYYDAFPTYPYRICHGVDFAYTNAPGSDFFAAITGRIYGRKLYLVDVQRHKLDATLLEGTCKRFLEDHGRAPMWSYQSGPEIGLSKLLITRGVPVGIMRARYNKLVRAQKTIRRWNDREILIPSNAAWVTGFLQRLLMFRGHEKDRDDEVDALVSMADANLGGASAQPMPRVSGRKPYPGMLT